MKDRVSTYPGRVLITPESGEPYYATLTRADNPTVEGTPLNKENLLSDSTASAYGLDGTAVPNSIFLKILDMFGDTNENISSKAKFTFGTYTGNGESSRKISLPFTPSAVFLFSKSGATTTSTGYHAGGLAVSGSSVSVKVSSTNRNILSITSYGFNVSYYYSDYTTINSNEDGLKLMYVALE